MVEKRSPDSAEQRERIDVYLGRNGFSAFGPRIVPLTGDASDRRYYRILTAHGTPFVLALHATAFDVNTLPFANVARLLERMPVPIPKILGHADDIGVLALEDLGDVTLQAHLGAATSSQHSALYRQAVALIATIQKRGAELESPEYPALPDRVRRREAHLGDGVLHQALHRGLPRRGDFADRARGAARGIQP